MREDGSGRNTVPPWGDASAVATPVYAVGDRVTNGTDFGAVTALDPDEATMGVTWEGETCFIVYPLDATYLRKAMPWE